MNTDNKVNHPSHYGKGANDPYETIKVIQAWNLSFELGNVVKYVARAGKKGNTPALEDLQKAMKYLQFEMDKIKSKEVDDNSEYLIQEVKQVKYNNIGTDSFNINIS